VARRNFATALPNNSARAISADWVNDLDAVLDRGLAVTPQDFGAVADDVTDDGPAFAAAIAYLESIAVAGRVNGTIYRSAPTLFVPAGLYYLSSTTIEPLVTIRIKGEGGLGWSAATCLRFAEGTPGVRLQAHNTAGLDSIAAEHFAGEQVLIEDICFSGAYDGTNEAEIHGFHPKRPFHLRRCTFENFQGDGFYCTASVGSGAPNEGNANMGRAEYCHFNGNRNGNYVRGTDSNVMTFFACQFNENRKRGSDDYAFLHNAYYDCHTANNGIVADMPMPTLVSHMGNRFTPIDGQEAGAATNAPPATATNNTWWRFAYVGDVAGAVVPAWTNGIEVRAGGSYAGAGWLWSCYEEGGQGPSLIDTPGAVYEGNVDNKGTGQQVGTYQGWHRVGSGDGNNGLIADGYSSFNGRVDVNGELINFNGTAPKIQLQNAGVDGGYILCSGGVTYINGSAAGGTKFRVGDVDICAVGATQFFPGTDNAYDLGVSAAASRWRTVFAMQGNFATDITVGGVKVIGAQGAAVADATDAASAITQLNLALARLRAHGLIAT
jgi:hypothetical protein